MASELRFRMAINAEEASRYYQGTARFVVVMAENGQKVQFPAQHIRPFINQLGVRGHFSIQFDDDNKLIALKKIAD
jgi:hypothetical protein